MTPPFCSLRRYCLVLDDATSEYVASLTQKNPKQKAETLRLLATVVGESAKKDVSKASATLLPVVAKMAGEPMPDIREAAMQARSEPHSGITLQSEDIHPPGM